jgi:hypothetical protein
MLSVNAGKSLVSNIGFDGSGTHSGNQDIYVTNLHLEKLSVPISTIEENRAARKLIERYHRKTYSLWAKAMRRIRNVFH